MSSQQTSLYIKIEKNSMVKDRHVKLSDVARMTGTDEAMIRQLKQMKIYSFPQKAKKTEYVQVMTSLKIFEMIQAQYPNVDITNEGEADFVIEYEPALQPSQIAEYAKTAVLCVLVFFGAAFTIMAFNNDISVTELFQKLYYQVMGKESTGITELEICYSIGLPVGVIIFFNHFGNNKITNDSTPIQVEMRKYEKDIDDTYIANCGRGGKTIDADSAGTYFSWSIWNMCRIIRRLCGSSIGGNFKDLSGYLPQNESKSGIVGDSLVYGIGKDSRLTFLFYKTVIRFLK